MTNPTYPRNACGALLGAASSTPVGREEPHEPPEVPRALQRLEAALVSLDAQINVLETDLRVALLPVVEGPDDATAAPITLGAPLAGQIERMALQVEALDAALWSLRRRLAL